MADNRTRIATTVRLSDADAATLDEIAAALYTDGREASRVHAMRRLIEEQRRKIVVPAVSAASEVAREVMSEFWKVGAKRGDNPPWAMQRSTSSPEPGLLFGRPVADVTHASPLDERRKPSAHARKLEDYSDAEVMSAYAECGRNKTRAARALGVARSTLRDRIERIENASR